MSVGEESFGVTVLEDRLWVVESKTGISRYDFDFSQYFTCRHPIRWDDEQVVVARMGAAPDYAERYARMLEHGLRLVHTPDEYERTSVLPVWYPLIEGLTPLSHWFEEHPEPEDIERLFDYPVFLKGERQTNKHDRFQSIIEGPEQLREVLERWRREPILHWQRVVCREFLELRPVVDVQLGAGLPKVFEFRSFWWGTECVGIGPYWMSPRYELSALERAQALELGEEVARRIGVTFLVIDLAQTVDGRWVVIECNDGQDSGYMGVDRLPMWRRVVDVVGT